MRILLIEDDASLGEGLRTALRRAALTVDWLRDGTSALAALRDGGVDLAVLDLGLPQMDGMEVIRQARRAGVTTPILVLSARERPADRTLGLDAGADDYLGKPFDTTELLARVRALVRRTGGRAQPTLRMGALELDPSRLEVIWRGRPLDLPRREFALLRLLMEQRGRPISRESAQQRLYGWDEDVSSNALDVHIHALRKKLDPALIRTLRGVGYALDERVASEAEPQDGPA